MGKRKTITTMIGSNRSTMLLAIGLTCFLSLIHCLFITTALAKDIGIIGRTYPINEMDFLTFIQLRLERLKETGKIKGLEKRFTQQSINSIQHPKPVENITTTTIPKTRIYDPSITISQDLYDDQGNVFAKAGTHFNPLTKVSLTKALLFYDARDKGQVCWAVSQNKKLKGKTKLILTGGSFIKQSKLFKRKVYYDQLGKLTKKLGIHHVPVSVTQEGLHLLINEEKPCKE